MADNTKIRRIKAKEAEVVAKPQNAGKLSKISAKIAKKPTKSVKKSKKPKKSRNFKVPKWLGAIGRFFGKLFGPAGRYIKGSWQELRVTKWPNRRATWSLSVAVILFSIFFAALILSFDNLFEWLLELTLNLGGK
ncbi:MAG: preprotein translocase subunit SecE [Candidatus Nomurabacteria bacterium]|jgi:preprotein translocase SecE subunit|nr:preprotein translocase subunit SecE [Candidatus Nomurabacteria bacterium]